MSVEEELVELRGRVSALQFAFVVQTIMNESQGSSFNPVEFAAKQSSFWAKIGEAMNEDGSPSDLAFEKGLSSLGTLLSAMAKPINDELSQRR